jgi:hypothetical protein
MKLKLHRTVRTESSEEIYIYDLDLNDEAGEPMDIGKMDVHYTADQIVGTVLFWKDWQGGEAGGGPNLQEIVDEVLEELAEPLGVSGEYDMEYYICDRDSRQFVSNIDDEFDFEDEAEFDEEEFEDADEEEEDVSESKPMIEGNGSAQN